MHALDIVPASELAARLAKFRLALSAKDDAWQMAIVTNKLSLYYFTGVMHDGVLVILPDAATFWVRRDYESAVQQSHMEDLQPMRSFRSLAQVYDIPAKVYLETATLTLDRLAMMQKYLPFTQYVSMDGILRELRAVKSPYEQDCMRAAGRIHDLVLGQMLPELLCEGMSEAEATGVIFGALLSEGTMGIGRFNQTAGEDVCGVVSFGTNMLTRTAFDGPFGSMGTCPAMPVFGSHDRKLKHHDLVLVDMPAGVAGYNTDKSVVCISGSLARHPQAEAIYAAHQTCLEIEQKIAEKLVVGAIPSQIYAEIWAQVPAKYDDTFMNSAKFLGHGVGLVIDESPVLAHGFDAPLQAGVTLAVEPKIALLGIGGVGTENTWLVREGASAECLTGGSQNIVEI